MVSIGILMTLAILVLPQWNRYKSVQMANQAAQELASDLRRLSSEAVRKETYMYVQIDGTQKYWMFQGDLTPAGNTVFNAYKKKKVRDFSKDMGRITISPSSGIIKFGRGGWVDATSADGKTHIAATSGTGSEAKYVITVSCGFTPGTYQVQVTANGAVKVVTP